MTPRRSKTPEPDPESLVTEAARRLVSTVSEVVPPQALLHLINAQREILLAVSSVVSHNMARGTGSQTNTATARRRPAKIELD